MKLQNPPTMSTSFTSRAVKLAIFPIALLRHTNLDAETHFVPSHNYWKIYPRKNGLFVRPVHEENFEQIGPSVLAR